MRKDDLTALRSKLCEKIALPDRPGIGRLRCRLGGDLVETVIRNPVPDKTIYGLIHLCLLTRPFAMRKFVIFDPRITFDQQI